MASDFNLCSNHSYAKLSSDELKSLGKEAALDFLNSGTSLNESVVKVAQRYPSISTHQVRRVVEFANQEAFSHLFEKQAGDKNIDFNIADPAEVIHIINSGVRPVEVMSLPEEYSMGPVKMASAEVEQDLALSKSFGVVLKSATMEKVASCSFLEASPADRILAKVATLNLKPKKYVAGRITKLAFGEGAPTAMAGSSPDSGMSADEHHERMLALQREIELAKKREELSKIQQKSIDGMGAVPGQEAAQGQMPAEQPPAQMPQEQMQPQPGMEQGMMPPGQQMPPEQAAQPFAGPMVAPPGSSVPKTASLLGEALRYVRSGRPNSALVVEDLRKSASLGSIRSAIRTQEKRYPESNPHRELVETRQKIAKIREEAVCASDTNRELTKEAATRFYKLAEQFLWDGGKLGEVLQMMESTAPNPLMLKVAADFLTKRLSKRGLDKVAARADLISYEISNRGKKRFVDCSHPVAESFESFCKLASNQPQLDESRKELDVLCLDLDKAIQEVWKNASSK